MKTMMWSAAGLFGLLVLALTVAETTEAPAAAADSPRVVRIGEMSVERAAHQSRLLETGRVLVTGGCAGHHCGSVHALAELYDPATRSFRSVAAMATARASHAAIALPDGRVLVTGGHRARGEVLRSAEIFDPATGEFQPTGDMIVARHKHATTLLADGKVLIVGGSDARDFRGRNTSTELYDPATGLFSPGAEMRWARHKIRDAVVRRPSGAVLVAGGAAQPELFDPAGRIFVPAEGELDGSQMFATATLLPGGEVLILGGYDDRIESSSAAWLVGSAH